jgi:hypothetical protein
MGKQFSLTQDLRGRIEPTLGRSMVPVATPARSTEISSEPGATPAAQVKSEPESRKKPFPLLGLLAALCGAAVLAFTLLATSSTTIASTSRAVGLAKDQLASGIKCNGRPRSTSVPTRRTLRS